MTETDKEIQELRRENRRLRNEIGELQVLHFGQQAELVRLRREIERLVEDGKTERTY